MNKFIAIEGVEGAGKSTVIEAIQSYFNKNISERSVFTREPGGTEIAEKIRLLLIDKDNKESLCSEAELLLMYASRVQHFNNLINPELKRDSWVISDRFNWSSLAYQGGGRGVNLDSILSLDKLFLSEAQPGLIIYLDIDPVIGLQRIKNRNQLDRFEEEKLHFFNNARDVYLRLCKSYKNSILIDSSLEKNIVIDNVIRSISDYIAHL
jgi:dTMP kinase